MVVARALLLRAGACCIAVGPERISTAVSISLAGTSGSGCGASGSAAVAPCPPSRLSVLSTCPCTLFVSQCSESDLRVYCMYVQYSMSHSRLKTRRPSTDQPPVRRSCRRLGVASVYCKHPIIDLRVREYCAH